jgi:hypothetical protein
MNLDFAALSGPASGPSTRKSWGQLGTVGTQAFMRVPASSGVGDRPGTGGDNGANAPTNTGMVAGTGRFPPLPCPRPSPPCPQPTGGGRLDEINVSPVSPLVPGAAGANGSSEDSDREAFEERAAIMEFDSGMTRADAQAAARALLGTAA